VSRARYAVLALALLAGCTHRYQARGVVVSLEPDARRVTISHEPIGGLMEAMVMPFDVGGSNGGRAAPLTALQPGDRVAFRLNVRRGRSWIDALRVVSAARTDVGLLTSPIRPVLVAIGAGVPDFELVDHRGRLVTPTTLRGHVVVVSFIYTRCPLPDYCPRVIANLKAMAARFRERLGRDLLLAAVTFDPRFDSTAVMADFARAHGADAPGWLFLTGPEQEIGRVCDAFGIERWPDQGLFTHTLQTAVLDRDGRLAGTIEGKDYDARQLGDFVSSILGR
jgi:protein SCO1/2